MNPNELSTSELIRKMVLVHEDEEAWRTYANAALRRGGFSFGDRHEFEGTVLHSEWQSEQSSSYRKYDSSGRQVYDYGSGRYEYEKEVLRPAREMLFIDFGVPGILFRAPIATTNKKQRIITGEPVVLRGTLNALFHDMIPYALSGWKNDPKRYWGWGLVTVGDIRVNRKKTKGRRAMSVVRRLALEQKSGGKINTLGDVVWVGRRKDVPIAAAIEISIDEGRLHLVYNGSNEEELDYRRREPSGPVETIQFATARVVRGGYNSFRHQYTFAEGRAPKGDFTNPWSPDETMEGLAKRGDWVTANPGRRDREGCENLDTSSMGLHVGMGATVWNFWVQENAGGWGREAKRYRETCLRFDILFRDCHPNIEIDLDTDEVRYLMGDELVFKLSYSASDEERILAHAHSTFEKVLDPDDIRTIVKWRWKSAKADVNRRLQKAGLLHLVHKLDEKEN